MATRIKQECIGEGCCPCEQSCYHTDINFRACVTPNVSQCYESGDNAKTGIDWEDNFDRDYIGVTHTRSWNLGVFWAAVPAGLTARAVALGRTVHYLVYTIYNSDTPTGVNCTSASLFASTQPVGGATDAKCPSVLAKTFITRVVAPAATVCPWVPGTPKGPRILRTLDRTNLHDWGGDCDPHKLPNVMLWVVASNGTYNDTGFNPANDLLMAQVIVCVSKTECYPASGADTAICCLDPELMDPCRCRLYNVGTVEKSCAGTRVAPNLCDPGPAPPHIYPSSITVTGGGVTQTAYFVLSGPSCGFYSSYGNGAPPACYLRITFKNKGKCDQDGSATAVWTLSLTAEVTLGAADYVSVGSGDIIRASGDRRYPFPGTCSILIDNVNLATTCWGDVDDVVDFTIEA